MIKKMDEKARGGLSRCTRSMKVPSADLPMDIIFL